MTVSFVIAFSTFYAISSSALSHNDYPGTPAFVATRNITNTNFIYGLADDNSLNYGLGTIIAIGK